MKLIKPSYEIINQSSGIDGIYKQIEIAGRTCYKSENKITENSAKEFVDRMIKSGHGAMLEHGTVYLILPISNSSKDSHRYSKNKYSKSTIVFSDGEDNYSGIFVTTNLRVLVENNWLDDLQYICEPTEHHEKRISVKFICDRGVSHEYVRHRVFSFAQESTRYCNYSKDKFSNLLTYIIPEWLILSEGKYIYLPKDGGIWVDENNNLQKEFVDSEDITCWINSLAISEKTYFKLLEDGWKPQQARSVLPNSLKTELVMTGFESDWKHFFKLRCVNNAHPQARELAIPLEKEFNK